MGAWARPEGAEEEGRMLGFQGTRFPWQHQYVRVPGWRARGFREGRPVGGRGKGPSLSFHICNSGLLSVLHFILITETLKELVFTEHTYVSVWQAPMNHRTVAPLFHRGRI